jgi:mannose-6-phosphate isomerase-like protein (cupin superfamily)
MDIEPVRRAWAARGFSCDLWIDPPGQVWSDFVHAVDELVMPVEGAIELTFAGVLHRPEVGQELLIPARALHTVRNVGPGEARWLYGYRLT